MGNYIMKDNVRRFLELIQKPTQSNEELKANARVAIGYIADDLNIGKVELQLSVLQSEIKHRKEEKRVTLYQSGRETKSNPITYDLPAGADTTVMLYVYQETDRHWTEEESSDIGVLVNQIAYVFSMEHIGGLLKNAMLTDLSTGIPNMSAFMEFAGKLFAQRRIRSYTGVYFNIHNFKYVNKVLPYLHADGVMKLYADKLVCLIGPEEMVARLGGDNYVALIQNENVEHFLQAINQMDIVYPYHDETKKFSFGATIGAAGLNDITDVADVMIRTSIAYQMARQLEKTGVVYFHKDFYKNIMRQKEVIAGFYRALEQKEFVVYYQPKVNAVDKKICGAEALVRWCQQGEIVYPKDFIPILEKDGSICKLDFYVLERTCELLSRCTREGLPLKRISINFSRKHIGNKGLAREIVEVIDKYNVPHEFIEIELTESEDFRDYIVMAKLIDELKAEGISTSIDDFGTGYSSLNMLKMASIDLLKIDKSFIPSEEEYENKKKDCIMFENIAMLAKALGYKVVIEGVETLQQYEYLRGVGCDIIQGFYFDRPLPVDTFLQRIVVGGY